MNTRKHIYDGLDVHAEVYHRSKIDALRAEGERLRHELRQRGVDPIMILHEAHQTEHTQEQN